MGSLVFFDIETTGLDFKRDRIVEVGLVIKGRRGRPRERSFLINPKVPIKKSAYRVHGISFDDVKGEPTFAEIKDELLSLIKDGVLVGFNILDFDLPFLNFELYRLGHPPVLNPVVDIKRVAKALYSDAPNSLARLATFMGVRVKDNHRALADARITKKIFDVMKREHPEIFSNTEDLENLSLSAFPSKVIDMLRIAREYGWVSVKYYSRRYGLLEWKVRPITVLKSYVIGDTGEGRFKYFNVMRIIRVSPPEYGWL